MNVAWPNYPPQPAPPPTTGIQHLASIIALVNQALPGAQGQLQNILNQILAKANSCRNDQAHGNHALRGDDELLSSVAQAEAHALANNWTLCRYEMDHPDTGGDKVKGKKRGTP